MVVAARARVADREATITVRLTLARAPGNPQRLRAYVRSVRAYGFLPAPMPLLGMGLLYAVGGSAEAEVRRWRSSTAWMSLELNPLELLLWRALPPAGWRMPSYRATAPTQLVVGGGSWSCTSAALIPARPSPSRRRRRRARRAAEGDQALQKGDLPGALESYRTPEGRPRSTSARFAVLASLPGRFAEAIELGQRLVASARPRRAIGGAGRRRGGARRGRRRRRALRARGGAGRRRRRPDDALAAALARAKPMPARRDRAPRPRAGWSASSRSAPPAASARCAAAGPLRRTRSAGRSCCAGEAAPHAGARRAAGRGGAGAAGPCVAGADGRRRSRPRRARARAPTRWTERARVAPLCARARQIGRRPRALEALGRAAQHTEDLDECVDAHLLAAGIAERTGSWRRPSTTRARRCAHAVASGSVGARRQLY